MPRKRLLFLFLSVAPLVHVASAPVALAQPTQASEGGADAKAEALRERGVKLCKRRQLDEGIDALDAALRAKADPEIATELGACEIQAAKYASAAGHLQRALQALPADGEPEQRNQVQAFVDQARARVGTLTITVNVGGADVFVGGRFAGVSPLPEGSVFVAPGDVTVSAKASSGGEVEKTVRVAAGGKATVSLVVPPKSAEPDPFAPRESPTLIPAFVFGGVGLIAGAIGIGLYASGGATSRDADDQLEALRAQYGAVPCPAAPGCADLKALRQDRDDTLNLGTGFLIGGGVALAGAIGYGIWALKPPSSSSWRRAALLPVASPEGGGAFLRGAF